MPFIAWMSEMYIFVIYVLWYEYVGKNCNQHKSLQGECPKTVALLSVPFKRIEVMPVVFAVKHQTLHHCRLPQVAI
jgi:hypothetical protein